MVAFSFKRMFVPALAMGLGIDCPAGFDLPPGCVVRPKRQTIRAERKDKRLAPDGVELQLYFGLRTQHARLIGRATCTGTDPIMLRFGKRETVWTRRYAPLRAAVALDRFARSDGFLDWNDLRDFWREEHDVASFHGFITYWVPK